LSCCLAAAEELSRCRGLEFCSSHPIGSEAIPAKYEPQWDRDGIRSNLLNKGAEIGWLQICVSAANLLDLIARRLDEWKTLSAAICSVAGRGTSEFAEQTK